MAAQYGTAYFKTRSGRSIIKDIYFNDTNAALVNWDNGAGAGAATPTDWSAPELMVLKDLVLAAALATPTKTQLCRNGVPTGDMLRNAVHLASVVTRPALTVFFAQGDRISFIQLT